MIKNQKLFFTFLFVISLSCSNSFATPAVVASPLNISISSQGNVGIGTRTPANQLDVNGTIIAQDPTSPQHAATKYYLDNKIPANLTVCGNYVVDPGEACDYGIINGTPCTVPCDQEQCSWCTSDCKQLVYVNVPGAICEQEPQKKVAKKNIEIQQAPLKRTKRIATPINSAAIAIFMNSDGNVGIGTLAPDSKLDVNGFITTQTPTQPNHVVTKQYVDSLNIPTCAKPPVQICGNSIREGTEVCDNGFYNFNDCNVPYIIDPSRWCNYDCSKWNSCPSAGKSSKNKIKK